MRFVSTMGGEIIRVGTGPRPCRLGNVRAILLPMNAVRGRVRGGRIEVDSPLPEGAEVVVLTNGEDEAFDLDDARVAELETRMAEADTDDVESAAAVLAGLRAAR